MQAVVMNGIGDTDVMEFVTRPEPAFTPGHVLVEVEMAGVNFMDIGVRQGMAWTESPNPKVLGVEGAGRVLSIGEGVTDIAVDDRVAWVYAPGSYAERHTIPATSLVRIPDFIDNRTAAAVMMRA